MRGRLPLGVCSASEEMGAAEYPSAMTKPLAGVKVVEFAEHGFVPAAAAALKAQPDWKPEGDIPTRMTGGNCTTYGLTTWGDLFTPRQLVALTTFSDLVLEARERVRRDALAVGLPDDKPLRDGDTSLLQPASRPSGDDRCCGKSSAELEEATSIGRRTQARDHHRLRRDGLTPLTAYRARCWGRAGADVERRSSGSQFYLVQGKTYQPAELDQVMARSARYGTPVTYTEEQKKTYTSVGGTPHLDGAYTVFGEVVEGLEVLDAIAAQPGDGRDRPLTDIRMFMRVLE